MATLSVSITPSPSKLGNAFLRGNLSNFLKGEINRLAMSVERYAKQLAPVGTPESTHRKRYVGGRLRASIHTTPFLTGLGAWVSTKTNYAIFVHDGTRYMRARPFMTTGAAFAQVAELKDINIRLDKEFTKAFKTL